MLSTNYPTTYIQVRKAHLREFMLCCFGTDSEDKQPTIRFPARHEANYFIYTELMRTPKGWRPPTEPEYLRVILPINRVTRSKTFLPKNAQEELATLFYTLYFKPVFFKWMHKEENGRNFNDRIDSFICAYNLSPDSFDALKKSDYRNRIQTASCLLRKTG